MLKTPDTGGFIFDTSCLNYFALTKNLSLLEQRYGGRAFVSRHVIEELKVGCREHQELEPLLTAGWFDVLRIEEVEDLASFTDLLKRLGNDERNGGEAATIILAIRHDLTAVIDEAIGRRFAKEAGLEVTGTLGILARVVRDGQLSEDDAWMIHQEMVSMNPNGFRSPISRRTEFTKLCRRRGLQRS